MQAHLVDDLLVRAFGRNRVSQTRDGRSEVPNCNYPLFCARIQLEDAASMEVSFGFHHPALSLYSVPCWNVGCYIPGGNGISIVMMEDVKECDGMDALQRWVAVAATLKTRHIRQLTELSPFVATFEQFVGVVEGAH